MAVFVEMQIEINTNEIENIKKYIQIHGGTRINIQQTNDVEQWLSWDQEDEIYYDAECDQQIDYITIWCKEFIKNNFATKESVMKMIESNSFYLSEVQYDSMENRLEKEDFKKIEKQFTKSNERGI